MVPKIPPTLTVKRTMAKNTDPVFLSFMPKNARLARIKNKGIRNTAFPSVKDVREKSRAPAPPAFWKNEKIKMSASAIIPTPNSMRCADREIENSFFPGR